MEISKFVISGYKLVNDKGWDTARSMYLGTKPRDAAMYAVPGLLYAINNNLEIYALNYMDIATNRLLNNLKILTTALMYRVIMRQEITKQQYVALGLLLLGSTFAANSKSDQGSGEFYITTFGVFIMIFYSFVSGFASVFNEYIMKNGSGCENIFLQNLVLYSWGILFNCSGLFYSLLNSPTSSPSETTDDGVVVNLGEYDDGNGFYGFYSFAQFFWWTCFVLNGTFHGLIISGVMKYLSSIWKLFMSASAIFAAALFQIMVFGASITFSVLGSFVLVSFALYLYKTPGVLFVEQRSASYQAVELSNTSNNDKYNSGNSNDDAGV
jgi:hypothetical protein